MRIRRASFALALLLVVTVPAGPSLGGSGRRATLRAGDSVFWNGPYMKDGSGRTFVYRINVTEPGFRLRIGLDKPEIGDVFDARVYAPGGNQVGSFGVALDLYSAEESFSPRRGEWRVVVDAQTATETDFRVRAKLEESAPSVGRGRDVVAPNLQILPPHDANFFLPISNGSAGGEPIYVDLAGAESCHPEEHAEEGAVRCLRFAYGVRNTGRGPMDLFYTGSANDLERPLFQRIHRADGSTSEREAGVAVFHKTHGHYHHSRAIGLQLFEVTDRKDGVLEAVSEKRTKGFAHRNELLREWDRFYPTPTMQGFGLLPGWADIYEWDRPGNYIDFGLNGDGYYVVRMKADPVDGILESNEKDNLGYTYLKVTGSEVKLLEAGRGRDPWDRCKIEVGFGGHPDPTRNPRPASCPKDTT